MTGSRINKANPTSHSCFSQRLRLHYLDWGNESAEAVLLIHGVQDHCHNWDWTSEALCNDYHVIVPDLRGHGDSEWSIGSGYSNLDYVYDIAQLVHQSELDKIHVIGHSMGGTIASLFTGLYPDKVASLISIEGVGGFWYQMYENMNPSERIRGWIDDTRGLAGRTPRRYPTMEDAFHRMQQSNPHLSEDRARHLTIHGSNRNEDGSYTWKFDNYSHGHTPFGLPYEGLTRIWSEITCPVLIINATEGFDHRIGQDGTDQHFGNLETVSVEDAGHWLHHDQFDEYITHVKSFLGKHRVTTD